MGKVLIAYYSRRGENYVNGSIKNLKLGNTEVVAQKIKALLPDADMFQIDTTYEYSKSYMTCIEEAKQELHDQARPEVKNPLESIDQYDTIILGYPNWWGTMPMVCYTFLESYDFMGKTIIPFGTHGGSGVGSYATLIKEYYPNATVLESLGISGSSIRNASSKTTVENWLKKLGVDKQSTSISNVRAKTNTANASYTLNGTRSNGQQRIYIRNGNKYIKR